MKAPELMEKLEESEKLIKELTVTWEEKLRKTEEIAQVFKYFLYCLCQITFHHLAYLTEINNFYISRSDLAVTMLFPLISCVSYYATECVFHIKNFKI